LKPNPILLEIFKNRFSSISDEMGVVLQRTAFSPNIKERKDFSCAIFDENGDIISQAAHIPVHLGSMEMSVKSVIQNVDLNEGDMAILNDPYKGGTHLPDITIVAPVFFDSDKPVFYVANRAHHSDIGGMSAGSMPLSNSIFQEGLIFPPLKFVENGEIDQKLLEFIKSNVRTPEEREGDFSAQIMANIKGIDRLKEVIHKYGIETVKFYSKQMKLYSEKLMRKRISEIPNGIYQFEDYLENGEQDIKISVSIHIKGDEAIIDFSKSDKQVDNNLNAVKSITTSAVFYVFNALINKNIPINSGCLKPITIKTKKGTIVDAQFPAPVSAGNVETSQRIVDVLLGALSKALPDFIPAASQGTMNNLLIGGIDENTGKPFSYYETIGGGMGASPFQDGESAVHSHMTNTLNTPIEAVEYEYPFLVTEYSIRKNSGGKGIYKGGDGIVREIKLLSKAEVTVISERRRIPPYGLFGGEPAMTGKNYVIKKGKKIKKSGKFQEILKKGDKIRIETPGGGGFGYDLKK